MLVTAVEEKQRAQLPGNCDFEGECEHGCRGDRRDVVLLVVDCAQNEGHHLLHSCLQLGMPLRPDCRNSTSKVNFLEVEISSLLSQSLE